MEKIFCNTRVMNANLTGVQRYTKSIIDFFPKGEYELVCPSAKYSRGVKGHLWDQLILPSIAKKHLLWSPNNTGPMYYKRQILTLHDLVHMDYPELLSKMYIAWYNFFLPVLCKNVEHIITISEFSRQRILELFNLPESKISVIYNGVNRPLKFAEGPRFKVPFKRYILSLGSIEPRKNIPLLLKAWGNISNKIPEDIGLVIVGARGNTQVFKDTIIEKNNSRVFFTGHLNDYHVNQLYSEALFFVYLSFYEGFGLPPLEAMAHGIPVLTGNRTSLPEVVGDAGVMIDPFSQSACENAIIELSLDGAKRKILSERSLTQSNKFSWKESSEKTWELLTQF